jgi:hypothetical protein
MWTGLSRVSVQCCYSGRRVSRILDQYVLYHASYKALSSNTMLITLRLLLSRLLCRTGGHCCMEYLFFFGGAFEICVSRAFFFLEGLFF